MNTTATSYSSEHSWSRRCSTESILSIQGKETDFVRDTSDTEWLSDEDDRDVEYEPCSEPEDEPPVVEDSSGQSDNEIIATKVIEVSVGDDGDLEFADSEQSEDVSDSEIDLHDYWHCAQCRARNNNPIYRYCEKCFQVRKDFFPPRPKRRKRNPTLDPGKIQRTFSQDSVPPTLSQDSIPLTLSQDSVPPTLSQDSVYPTLSQDSVPPTLSQDSIPRTLSQESGSQVFFQDSGIESQDISQSERGQCSNPGRNKNVILDDKLRTSYLKRRAESADRNNKRMRRDYSDSDTDSDSRPRMSNNAEVEVKPLIKTISDPSLTIESIDSVKLSKKVISQSLKEKIDDGMCIVCSSEPKSGVFVHGRIAHICCCYKCAVKVWAKAKRCPVCNCKVSNVLKAVVM